MSSLAGFSFEKSGVAFHLQKGEAGFGATTLWSWEFLLISEHNLKGFSS